MLENVIINVIVQFIPCIISFFLSRYSFDTLYELVKSKSPYKYTVPLIIPAETIIKKKKEKKRSARVVSFIAFRNARISRRCSRDIISEEGNMAKHSYSNFPRDCSLHTSFESQPSSFDAFPIVQECTD